MWIISVLIYSSWVVHKEVRVNLIVHNTQESDYVSKISGRLLSRRTMKQMFVIVFIFACIH